MEGRSRGRPQGPKRVQVGARVSQDIWAEVVDEVSKSGITYTEAADAAFTLWLQNKRQHNQLITSINWEIQLDSQKDG